MRESSEVFVGCSAIADVRVSALVRQLRVAFLSFARRRTRMTVLPQADAYLRPGGDLQFSRKRTVASNDVDRSLGAVNYIASSAMSICCRRGGGKDTSSGAPVGNADRAQGLGHRLRKSQAQTLPRRIAWSLTLPVRFHSMAVASPVLAPPCRRKQYMCRGCRTVRRDTVRRPYKFYV